MARPQIEAGEHLPRLVRHIGRLVILALEVLHRLEAVEAHLGDELHLLAEVAAEQLNAAIAGDVLRRDTWENLRLEDIFTAVGIPRHRPAVPYADDHRLHLPQRHRDRPYDLPLAKRRKARVAATS